MSNKGEIITEHRIGFEKSNEALGFLYKEWYELISKLLSEIDGINIELGGDWETFKDAPHFQLSWNEYVEESKTPEEESESIGERPSDTEVPSEDS